MQFVRPIVHEGTLHPGKVWCAVMINLRVDPAVPLNTHDTDCSERPSRPVPVLRRADCISGKYLIGDVLGKGGFAVVYDAVHLGLQCRMAIKVLHVDEETPEALVTRFREEARISAMVHHRHVLNVHDTGTLDDGSPYLVMEYIHGETLHARIGRGELPIPEVLSILCQLLRALAALGECGIVHRDVKPENVMLHTLSNGHHIVKLVDFGIAKKVDGTPRAHPSLLMGTPHYMSPEHLRGASASLQFDIYSAGVVLYEALVGSLPYDAECLPDLVYAILHGHPHSVERVRPDCPRDLLQIVRRAMHRDPAQRYATAQAMLRDLEECQRGVAATDNHGRVERGPGSDSLDQLITPWTVAAPSIAPSRPSRRKVALGRGLLTSAACLLVVLMEPHIAPSPPLRRPSPPQDITQASSTPVAQPSDQVLTAGLGAASSHTSTQPTSEQAFDRTERPRGRHRKPIVPMPVMQHVPARPEHDVEMEARRSLSAALKSYVRGEHASAYLLYQHTLALTPDDATAWRGLGIVAARLGHTRQARQALERYLALSPSAKDADTIRARLHALSLADI